MKYIQGKYWFDRFQSSQFKCILHYFVMIFCLAMATISHSETLITGTVQGGTIRSIPIAVPAFAAETVNATDLGVNITKVIEADLSSTGLFRALPSESFLEGAGDFDAPITYQNWSGIGAEILIKGSVAQSVDGHLQVKFRVYDIVSGVETGSGLQFNAPLSDWRRIAHKVSDAVYSRLTGEGPYFDTRIAFIAESGPKNARKKALAIMDSDGANLRYLTDNDAIVLAPRFSPNSRDLIYTSYETGMPQIVMMNTVSGAKRVLSELPGLAFSPRFSPNGSELAVSLIDESGNTDIYSIDLASGARSRLTHDAAIDTAPSYSPKGDQIVFESDRHGGQQIYLMSKAGGEAVKISQGQGRYATPVWSPRGDLIAFTKIEGGQFHIGVMNIDGSNERILTSSFIDEAPTWAPNGRVIMFFRQSPGADGATKLYSISLTGQNMVQIGTPEYASDPTWSNLLP